MPDESANTNFSINWSVVGSLVTPVSALVMVVLAFAGVDFRGSLNAHDLTDMKRGQEERFIELRSQIAELQHTLGPVLVMQSRLDAAEKRITNIEQSLSEARDIARGARQDLDNLIRQQNASQGHR